jgi:pimeloyl-ACP methyl ester carboxylesterase
MKSRVLHQIFGSFLLGGIMTITHAANAQAPSETTRGVRNVVLVHGAFADGSSWSKIIPLLEARGLHVVAVQNPLNTLADDVAATKRAIAKANGPVLLVGHSYGGAVITEAGNDAKVAGLVYVAAFAPGDGEAVADVAKAYPAPPGMAEEIADAAGFVSLSTKGVEEDFAPDLPPAERRLIAATQGPTAAVVFGTKISQAAWKSKPSWYVIATNDRMIPPELQRASAARLKATSLDIAASHVPMLSHPKEVASFIAQAAMDVAAR